MFVIDLQKGISGSKKKPPHLSTMFVKALINLNLVMLFINFKDEPELEINSTYGTLGKRLTTFA